MVRVVNVPSFKIFFLYKILIVGSTDGKIGLVFVPNGLFKNCNDM